MTVNDLLTEIFDRGLREGERKLSRRDRELFLIWDFVISFEMGSLDGYLYNRVAKRGRLEATAAALAKYEVEPLARVLGELARRFKSFKSDDGSTWEEACAQHITEKRLSELDDQVTAAMDDGYGLETSKLAKLVAPPRKKLPATKPKRRRRR